MVYIQHQIKINQNLILPQYRNSKCGTKALQILLEQEKENSGIFIEIEKVGLG